MNKIIIAALTLAFTVAAGALSACGAEGNMPLTPSENALPKADEPIAVYMTADISPSGLQAVFDALGIAPGEGDSVAVKVSTGEPPSSNYLRQELIGEFVKGLNGTYVECNTAYGGQREEVDEHFDLIYKADGNEAFVRRVEAQNGVHTSRPNLFTVLLD